MSLTLSLKNEPLQSGVGAGVLCIPCPPLISDRLFGVSSLHQLEPLTDNLLPREGWGLLGCRTKGGGVLVVPPSLRLPSKTAICPPSSLVTSHVSASLTAKLTS